MVSPVRSTASAPRDKAALSESEINLRRLLKSAPQDLWLDTLRRAGGSRHDGLVYWMLNQTECDFAIAVHAFYRSNPARHLDDPKPLPLRPGPADIFALVLLNWDTGSFRQHRLQIDPIDADPRAIARVRQKLMVHPRGSLPYKVPQQFLEPTGGAPMKLAPHMHPDETPHLWRLYRDLGLNVDSTPPGIGRRVAQVRTLFRRFVVSRPQP